MKHSAKALGAALSATRDETVGRPPLRSHEGFRKARRRARAVAVGLAGTALLTLSGCTDSVQRGWYPRASEGATNHTGRITDLWLGSWIAALIVGVIVWGLVIWCMIAYRRRKDETGVPAQIRYHLPLEVMYTVIPVMMIGVLFGYTARDQSAILDTSETPDVTIGVVGKQWSWDFNYKDADVYESGVMGQLNGEEGAEAELPTLYLPVDKRVQFDLTARDVIHSFWVPAFLMKMDTVPGIENNFQVIPTREGTFKGKCAELCGEYHSEMLFNVEVVSQAEFDQHMADLEARGQTGQLGDDLSRSERAPENSTAEEAGNSDALPASAESTTAEVK